MKIHLKTNSNERLSLCQILPVKWISVGALEQEPGKAVCKICLQVGNSVRNEQPPVETRLTTRSGITVCIEPPVKFDIGQTVRARTGVHGCPYVNGGRGSGPGQMLMAEETGVPMFSP